MGETMVKAVTQGSIRVRVLRVWSGGRRKGPVCGKNLEAPGGKFENCFIDDPELGRVRAVIYQLWAPTIVENDCDASHLNGGGDSAVVCTCRDRDETLRMRAQLGPGFPSKKRDAICRNANVDERQAIDGS
jgi:hypothetical protein